MKSDQEIKNSTIVAKDENFIKDVDLKLPEKDLDIIETKDLIKKFERKMLNYAKELKFEEAAFLRDKIDKLKQELKAFKKDVK